MSLKSALSSLAVAQTAPNTTSTLPPLVRCVGEFCEPETDMAVYIFGDEYEGDPAAIALDDRSVIVIVIGTPPERIPATADFSQA